jgi:hypothetical protein
MAKGKIYKELHRFVYAPHCHALSLSISDDGQPPAG